MLPLLRGFEPDRPVAFDRNRAFGAAAFCAAATAMSARLPAGRHVFNLCDGRVEFLLGSAAALLAGCTLVLPPSRLARTLDELLDIYPDSCCLVDFPGPAHVPANVATMPIRVELENALQASTVLGAWPPPLIAAMHQAAILFTSGSTGSPQPHSKTWGELCEGAQTFLRSFGSPSRRAAIIGTVPPQHMFGFETTAMLALQSGTPVLDAHPAFPADLRHALASAAELELDEIWLMSTPLQLRAFHRELKTSPHLRRIISATMPLDPELAQAIERDWNVQVDEVFGCTEGGILATRRPAQTRLFTPAAGLEFTRNGEGLAQVCGGHLPRALVLSDRLRPERKDFGGAGRFEVIGRDEDMVKIAGKRTSLQALTKEILAIAGVVDGVLLLPEPSAQRIAAIVVAPGCTADQIRASLKGRIDPAFMPRPLQLVVALPRDANGKLPMADLRALLAANTQATNRTVEFNADADVHAEETFTCDWACATDHPALPGHFPGHIIVPGVILLERLEALLEDSGYRVTECTQAKFLAPVAPEMRLLFRVTMSSPHAGQAQAQFSVAADGAQVAVGRLVCARVRDSL
ncbi:MAG: AMP-binding protein [Betaproteobacteria bacterium]